MDNIKESKEYQLAKDWEIQGSGAPLWLRLPSR